VKRAEDSRLQASGNISGVLVGIVTSLGDVTTVKLLLEDLLGMLLGLLRGVGVVDVGLVTSSDLSLRHDDELLGIFFWLKKVLSIVASGDCENVDVNVNDASEEWKPLSTDELASYTFGGS
jgi:hypothetical protein